MSLGCFVLCRQMWHQILNSRSACDDLRIPLGHWLIAYVLTERDRNMLVKRNLLDYFGVSGLVLVGFVNGLTKGVL